MTVNVLGSNRLASAFFLRRFKLAHICIQVTSIQRWQTSKSRKQFFIWSHFHV